jgi:hypothetical protein
MCPGCKADAAGDRSHSAASDRFIASEVIGMLVQEKVITAEVGLRFEEQQFAAALQAAEGGAGGAAGGGKAGGGKAGGGGAADGKDGGGGGGGGSELVTCPVCSSRAIGDKANAMVRCPKPECKALFCSRCGVK